MHVLLLGDLMASPTWLAKPSLLMIFSQWYQGILVSCLRKDGHRLPVLPFAEIAICKLLGQISSYYCLCLWWCACIV